MPYVAFAIDITILFAEKHEIYFHSNRLGSDGLSQRILWRLGAVQLLPCFGPIFQGDPRSQ